MQSGDGHEGAPDLAPADAGDGVEDAADDEGGGLENAGEGGGVAVIQVAPAGERQPPDPFHVGGGVEAQQVLDGGRYRRLDADPSAQG